jgi:hypothetical protein
VIAETQVLLHSQLYDVQAAANLIAGQLGKITNAMGTAVALMANDQLTYVAATGSCAPLAGSSGPIGADISEFLSKEEALNRAPSEVRAEVLGKHENSPVFFPVHGEGRLAGVLQLCFPGTESIQEHEIRSCQVMAGLMGETISRAAELEWKQSLAAERASMLEALERLRPHLERLAAEPAKEIASATSVTAPNGAAASSAAEAAVSGPIADERGADLAMRAPSTEPELVDIASETDPSATCRNCGFQLSDDAMFCGRCGTPRSVAMPTLVGPPTDSGIEEFIHADKSEAATMPEPVHEASAHGISDMPIPAAAQPAVAQLANELPTIEGSAALAIEHQPAEPAIAEEEQPDNLEIVAQPEKPVGASPWSSAARARKWLHSLQQTDTTWLTKHSGDVSVVIAVLVLLLVLIGWNTHPVPKKVARTNTPPQPSLTLFERMLVGLGLAEAPSAPVQTGNPNAQVWEDLHTGLYYCSGSELYGKTPGGKLTSQRDAQLDQFEPAARKACE